MKNTFTHADMIEAIEFGIEKGVHNSRMKLDEPYRNAQQYISDKTATGDKRKSISGWMREKHSD